MPLRIIDHPYSQGIYGSNSCSFGWDENRQGGCGQKAEDHANRERCTHAADGLRNACIDYYKDGCQHCTGGCHALHY
jgi:hypothetical protein